MPEQLPTPDLYGVETEYSALLVHRGNRVYEMVGVCHSEDNNIELYAQPESQGGAKLPPFAVKAALREMGISVTSEGMMSSGGRLYIDASGPEYATPETRTAEEAVHRTFDGDHLVYEMFDVLREWGTLQSFQLNRRNVDHNRTSRGVHLNTTTSIQPAKAGSQPFIMALATLNVVKGSMFGSGGLLMDQQGRTAFHHSPRLSITDTLVAHFTDYAKRPLARLPFKPDGYGLSRLETVTSDALNLGWPLKASLVVTNALIRILELDRDDVRLPVLRSPIRAAHIVGKYGFKARVGVIKGDTVVDESPQNLLAEICDIILKIDAAEGVLSDEARQVLPEIIDTRDRMNSDPESVTDQVESILRESVMQKKMHKKGVELDSQAMCRFDFAWDWIGGGIAETMRTRNRVGWQGFSKKYSYYEAERRRKVPPADTRAKTRAYEIEKADGEVDIFWAGKEDDYLHPYDVAITK